MIENTIRSELNNSAAFTAAIEELFEVGEKIEELASHYALISESVREAKTTDELLAHLSGGLVLITTSAQLIKEKAERAFDDLLPTIEENLI